MRTVHPKPGQYFVHCPAEGCDFNCVVNARAIQLLPLLGDKERLTTAKLQEASSYILTASPPPKLQLKVMLKQRSQVNPAATLPMIGKLFKQMLYNLCIFDEEHNIYVISPNMRTKIVPSHITGI